MNYRRSFAIAFLLIFLMINGTMEVFAIVSEFSIEELSKKDRETILENMDLSVLSYEPKKDAIDCFDVNERGEIAIGCSDFDNKTICIYSDNGEFQYGFSFRTSGKFGVEFDVNGINIYLVRSDTAVFIDLQGQIATVCKIQNTAENNSYWNNSVFLSKRKIGETEFILKNNMGLFNIFASNFSQLIAIDSSGSTNVIYDVNSTQLVKTTVLFGVIFVVIFITVLVVIYNFIKKHIKEKSIM